MVVGGVVYIYGPGTTPTEQINLATSTPTYMTYTPSDSSWLTTNQAGDQTAHWRYDAYGSPALGTPLRLQWPIHRHDHPTDQRPSQMV